MLNCNYCCKKKKTLKVYMKMKRERTTGWALGRGNQGPCGGNLAQAISYPGHYLSSTRSLLGFTWVIICAQGGRRQHARAIRRHSVLLLLQTEYMYWVDGGENGPRSLRGHYLHRGGHEHASSYPAKPVCGKMGLDPNAAGRSSLQFNEGIICFQQAKVATCKASLRQYN